MTDVYRQPGVLGVHSLDHFRLSVPKLSDAEAFYETFGLDVRDAPNGFDLHTAPDSHRWGTFREGPRKQLDYLSFGAFADDLPAFRERLKRSGVATVEPPAGTDGEGGF